MCLHAAAVISAVNTYTPTWNRRQDVGVGTRFLCAFRRVFGLEDLVEVEKFSIPPVDEILAAPFSLHLNHKHLGEMRERNSFVLFFCYTGSVKHLW